MNNLVHIAEFRSALQDYKPCPRALQILSQARLVLLVGPTSSGRNTLIAKLVEAGNYYFIVGDTTRELRHKDGQPIEENGREYWFRKELDVLSELQKGEYIEIALIHGQQVSGWSMHEVEKANQVDKIAIKEVTPDGARTVHPFKPDASIIFVLPPSFEEWQRRLKKRGQMDDSEYKRRMESACREFEAALNNDYYHFIINDTTEESATQVEQIVQTGRLDSELQHQGRQLAERLLLTTQKLVSSL